MLCRRCGEVVLGHSISTSESLLYVCAMIWEVNRNGGQDQSAVLLNLLRKASES